MRINSDPNQSQSHFSNARGSADFDFIWPALPLFSLYLDGTMASASLILDSDEDNVEFQDRGAKEGAMFQPIAHSDRPRANAQDSLPTWALAKPVGVNLVPDSQMPDSQVADSQLWFGDDIPASQPADSQEPADSQDLFGDSDGIGIPDTTEEKEEKNQVLKRKKPCG